ncbi:hypothetical protein MA16_Dca028060 [Dendrobium catenatum]|uniref:Uncharacterized protein n=1 Tax=Dendrobium catenatum TaxID=906689 RepID=A0A2I0VH54_9ASPA|nr:hypothetical protein MA16_Dca028060 [Dendrobium catenatum]
MHAWGSRSYRTRSLSPLFARSRTEPPASKLSIPSPVRESQETEIPSHSPALGFARWSRARRQPIQPHSQTAATLGADPSIHCPSRTPPRQVYLFPLLLLLLLLLLLFILSTLHFFFFLFFFHCFLPFHVLKIPDGKWMGKFVGNVWIEVALFSSFLARRIKIMTL